MTDTKPLAIVTGASRGIGFELARQFAQNNFDLLINAEDDRLAGAADELKAVGAEVETVQSDLRTYDGVERLYAAITATGRPINAAALNAGAGQGGRFIDVDLDKELSVIELNITSTVHLAHRLLRDMAGQGYGRMLFTSSVAADMPGTYQSVYNASKSFVQSFVVALRSEMSGTGVTLTSLMPGPVATDFFRRGELMSTMVGQGPKDDPAHVAKQGFDAMMNGEERVVASSVTSKAMETANKVLPDKVKAAAHGLMSKPGSGR